MTNLLKVSFFLFVCTWSTIAIAGKPYFVDFSANVNGTGTLEKPWNNLNTVNNFIFQTGDDVYFKCGTVSSGSERLIVKWNGTSTDQSVIGAYYESEGKPILGVNIDGRPVIAGIIGKYPGDWTPLVEIFDRSYVTFKDIKVYNSSGYGVAVRNSRYITIDNVHTQNTFLMGISFATDKSKGGVQNSIIEKCIVERANYNNTSGDGIDITGMFKWNTTRDIIVRNNIVFHCYEGIGVYKTAGPNILVEGNIIYDNRSFHLYAAGGSQQIIWRNNIVYQTNLAPSGRKMLLAIDNEGHRFIQPQATGHIQIYNNYIAGGKWGIRLINNAYQQTNPVIIPENISIYKNRFVDCDQNISIAPSFNGKNTTIENNISGIYTSGLYHVGGSTGYTGITWNGNIFNSIVSGRPATNHVLADYFVITNNWRNLLPGKVSVNMFDIKSVISGTQTKPPAPTILRIQ